MEDEVERRLHGEGGSARSSQGEAVWRDSDQAYKFCPGTTDGPTTEPSHFVGKYLCWAPDLSLWRAADFCPLHHSTGCSTQAGENFG